MSNPTSSAQQECAEEFLEAFSFFDRDGSGSITAIELEVIMRSLGRNPTPEEIARMVEDVDSDGSGEIDLGEFTQLMTQSLGEMDAKDEIREAFYVFDRDGSGSVTVDELKSVMCNLGEVVSDEQVRAMIKVADFDGDGELSLEDLLEFMTMEGHL